tara:strand:- start:700 stop:1311 length:612 start_codon:yes stop_codon:yes gene_type:complete
MSDRNMKYLNDNRIIYKRNPINDEPTHSTDHYDYYEDGTHENYHLFNSKSKITSYRSLKWHAVVLYYLNDYNKEKHAEIIRFICDKHNNFMTFKIDDSSVSNIINNTYYKSLYAPKNKIRKIIFKDYCRLNFKEKMQIVGKLLGRNKTIHEDDIYQCMIDLNESNQKITWNKIAKLLKCSERTVIRNINKELKNEKTILNEEI